MTIIRVILFVLIMFESLTSQRSVLWVNNTPVHLEWTPRLPLRFHSHSESVKVFL
jgi:hypothetical protein